MQKWQKNLYTVWLTQLISLIGFGFGLPFLPFYIQELGVTDPYELKLWTGGLVAAAGIMLSVMAPVWGFLADRYGKKIMLIRAMFGGMIALVGLGLSKGIYSVLVFRIIQGAFSGTVTSSAALVACGTPNERLSYALGFVSSSTFIGFSLGPAVGGLIAEHFGYRMSFFIGAGIIFVGFLLVVFLIEEPAPEDTLMQLHHVKPQTTGPGEANVRIITPVILSVFILLFFIRLTRVFTTPFLPLYIQELRDAIKGSARVTGLISGGISLVSALAGLTLSRLGDKYKRGVLLAVLLGCGMLISACLFFTSTIAGLAAVLMLTYFCIGGIEPLLMSVTSERVPAERRGSLFGVQTMVASLAWVASPLIGSWVSIAFSIKAIFITFCILLAVTFTLSAVFRKRIDS